MRAVVRVGGRGWRGDLQVEDDVWAPLELWCWMTRMAAVGGRTFCSAPSSLSSSEAGAQDSQGTTELWVGPDGSVDRGHRLSRQELSAEQETGIIYL